MTARAITTPNATCTQCGSELGSEALFQQCPRCLLNLGLWSEGDDVQFDSGLGEPCGRLEFDYELLERIGRGGMGVVYRARQKSLNRLVALKMIAVGDLASPSALARFRQEAETAARLDHPNIVAIIEVGEHDSNPFLVMRLVEGDSLAERAGSLCVPRAGRTTEARSAQERIASLLARVARAVDYAHGQGVLHRDLKPSNILLDREGIPHLTDFGIAKWLDQDGGITQTAELVGTLSYMPPEQAAGKRVSRAADIYSLGAILYELLTGQPAFDGPKMEVLRQVLEIDPPDPRLLNPAVDRDLATICLKCLDKEPGRRYGSALQLAEDLERWLRNEPVQARQAGPVTRLRRWSRRNRAGATLLFSLTIGIGVSLGLLANANREKASKSLALDILRTESARQLQEIWSTPRFSFTIKSETLSAMAGMEVPPLAPVEHRFSIALVATGNPLERALRAAPLLRQMEQAMTEHGGIPARLDLTLHKDQAGAVANLAARQVDIAQLNARAFLRARALDPGIQPLATILPLRGLSQTGVVFTRSDTGIDTLAELKNAAFLFDSADSMLTFWAKVGLARAGVHEGDLSRYRYLDQGEAVQGAGVALARQPGNPFGTMSAVEAVLAGRYDAGVVLEGRFREVAAERDLVALHQFEFSGELLVARGNFAAESGVIFQRAIAGLQDAESTLVEEPARFRPAQEADYRSVAEHLELEEAFKK